LYIIFAGPPHVFVCLAVTGLHFQLSELLSLKGIPQPGNLTKIKLNCSFCSDYLSNQKVTEPGDTSWSPVLTNHSPVREAEEGQGREAGEWGNKVFWKQTNV
jgi:hypothetical protein